MRILRARHLGMCFGVRDAITLALETSRQTRLTVFGDLVHNETVLAALRERGIQFQNEPGKVETGHVMITAHGTSERTLRSLSERGFEVSQATCPLVHHAHRTLQRLVDEGYHPVVIGKRDHVEVRGLTGDLERFDVILSEEHVATLEHRDKFGIVAQTTQPIDKVLGLIEKIRKRFPTSEVRFEDTVCQPTKQRQLAAVEMAQQSGVVVVVGGAHSNNTRELVATCRKFCPRVYHVQDAAELRPEWFCDIDVVGLTAGTSTPDATINDVENWLRQFAERRDAPPQKRSYRGWAEPVEAGAPVSL